MDGTGGTLEARLAELADAVRRLEGRVEALEQARPVARRGAAQAGAHAGRPASLAEEAGFDPGQASTVLSLGGRTFLVLAGAFVLRALTDSGRLPGWLGVGLGFLYAGVWIVMADRAGRSGQALSAGFYAVSVVVIGFPLLFEGATRFKLFSPVAAAAVLAALTGVALGLSARRALPALAWVVSLGGTATALALMASSGRLGPGAVYLVLLGVATLWIGYVVGWTALRWPVALVVDLVVLLVAVRAGERGTTEGAGTALVVQTALGALYLGSFAARTLWMGRKVVPFEVIQTAAVVVVGIGGSVWVAVRSGMGQAGFGAAATLSGIAAYAVAFAFVERRQKLQENFYFYTSVGIVLVLAGTALMLAEPVLSLAWCALAVAAALLGGRRGSRTLASHAAAYALAAGLSSGLLVQSAVALLVGSSVGWRPGFAAVAAVAALTAVAAITGRVARRTAVERLPPAAVHLALALGTAGLAVAWIAPLVAGGGEGASGGAVATVRTVALVAVALAAAVLGRDARVSEAGWLAYPLLGLTGFKMLLEDLRRGTAATMILAFACYGAALILVPRLRGRKGAQATGET